MRLTSGKLVSWVEGCREAAASSSSSSACFRCSAVSPYLQQVRLVCKRLKEGLVGDEQCEQSTSSMCIKNVGDGELWPLQRW